MLFLFFENCRPAKYVANFFGVNYCSTIISVFLLTLVLSLIYASLVVVETGWSSCSAALIHTSRDSSCAHEWNESEVDPFGIVQVTSSRCRKPTVCGCVL